MHSNNEFKILFEKKKKVLDNIGETVSGVETVIVPFFETETSYIWREVRRFIARSRHAAVGECARVE